MLPLKCINRTFMELKRMRIGRVLIVENVLIEPLWN